MVQVNVQVRRYEIFVKKKHTFCLQTEWFPVRLLPIIGFIVAQSYT